eukprot:GHVQ01028267.1.p1 GENE.GHVQ01028267.1~~GHVQ01028267.1.p1  ORF type:complete len:146 (+),score=11.11 GHVQ01028267.1:285-722(+)
MVMRGRSRVVYHLRSICILWLFCCLLLSGPRSTQSWRKMLLCSIPVEAGRPETGNSNQAGMSETEVIHCTGKNQQLEEIDEALLGGVQDYARAPHWSSRAPSNRNSDVLRFVMFIGLAFLLYGFGIVGGYAILRFHGILKALLNV